MTSLCISSLKNLTAIEPALGDLVVPFFLQALDPEAVTRSHQAPVAMYSLNMCFRSLMFPDLVMLPYLPQILKLCLPGVDPNDVNKTVQTLTLYSTILGWVPVRAAYCAPAAGSAPLQYVKVVTGGATATGEWGEGSETEIGRAHV